MTGQTSYRLTTEGDLGERKTACVDPNIVRARDGAVNSITVLADASAFITKSGSFVYWFRCILCPFSCTDTSTFVGALQRGLGGKINYSFYCKKLARNKLHSLVTFSRHCV